MFHNWMYIGSSTIHTDTVVPVDIALSNDEREWRIRLKVLDIVACQCWGLASTSTFWAQMYWVIEKGSGSDIGRDLKVFL